MDGSLKWAVDMKLPRMVHARNVRPPFAGATLQRIDESSVADVPGFIRVVSRGNYVAVICEREEKAIRAARQLKVDWKRPDTAPFPASTELFDYMRRATPTSAERSAMFRAIRPRPSRVPSEWSKPNTKCPSRDTRPSARRTRWRTLPTGR